MKILFKLLFLVISLTLLYKRLPIKIDNQGVSFSSEKFDKVMAVSNTLNTMTNQLETNCANNKQGLTEQACIQNIRDKNQLCMQEVMKQFSDKLNNPDNVQTVADKFADCIKSTH